MWKVIWKPRGRRAYFVLGLYARAGQGERVRQRPKPDCGRMGPVSLQAGVWGCGSVVERSLRM